MPSGQSLLAAKVGEEQQGCPNRFLVAQNVRMTLKCYECNKPQCIYSKKALTVREERGLCRLLDRYQYTCGSIITPDGDCMQGVVFVRLQLCCQSPVEVSYYSSVHVAGLKDLCCHCGESGADRDVNALHTHRVVLPVCKTCKDSGKPIIKRLPLKN